MYALVSLRPQHHQFSPKRIQDIITGWVFVYRSRKPSPTISSLIEATDALRTNIGFHASDGGCIIFEIQVQLSIISRNDSLGFAMVNQKSVGIIARWCRWPVSESYL